MEKSHPNIFEISFRFNQFEAGCYAAILKKEICAERCQIRFQNGECNLADYLAAVRRQTGLQRQYTGEFLRILNSVLCYILKKKVDFVGVDLVGS